MDDSFSFRARIPVRRRIHPWVFKASIAVALIAFGVGTFAHWVIASEDASIARAAHHRVAAEDVAVTQISSSADPVSTDADAKEAARIALAAARAGFSERRTFRDAGPAQLSALQPGFVFVDGPSTMARIVSVASTAGRWAAAIESSTGACFWIRADAHGVVERGTMSDCVGSAALTARATGW
jgi:hypothetical protein